jgi:hypothetical protein
MSTNQTPDLAPDTKPSKVRVRCRYVSRTGRLCRYLAHDDHEGFCKLHRARDFTQDLQTILFETAGKFKTPECVLNALHTIFHATFDGHITERRGAVLTYMCNSILNAQRACGDNARTSQKRDMEAAKARVYQYLAGPDSPMRRPTAPPAAKPSPSTAAAPSAATPAKQPSPTATKAAPPEKKPSPQVPAQVAPPAPTDKKIAPPPETDIRYPINLVATPHLECGSPAPALARTPHKHAPISGSPAAAGTIASP